MIQNQISQFFKKRIYSFCFILVLLILSVNQLYSMQIFVVTPRGTHITIEVEPIDLIEDVKAKILDKEGILPELQVLVYNGVTLENGNTLQDYNISKDAILQLIILQAIPTLPLWAFITLSMIMISLFIVFNKRR